MGSYKPCALIHSCIWPAHDERQQKHSPREPNNIECDDEERDLLAPIVLRVCVRNAENKG